MNLSNCLASSVSQGQKAKVLILGARGGLSAELMLPFASHLDLVDSDSFDVILRERFEKRRDVKYFFGKEGWIGEWCVLQKPEIKDT